MRSTGEVMGIDREFAMAFAKAQIGSGTHLPAGGTAFVSVKDTDKPQIVPAVRQLLDLGFRVLATSGTADYLRSEEHTSELQSLMRISYAVFSLQKKNGN